MADPWLHPLATPLVIISARCGTRIALWYSDETAVSMHGWGGCQVVVVVVTAAVKVIFVGPIPHDPRWAVVMTM